MGADRSLGPLSSAGGTRTCRRVFTSDPRAVANLHDWAARRPVDAGLAPHDTQSTRLILAELVDNAIEHAAPPRETTLVLTPALVRVEVSDDSWQMPVEEPDGQGVLLIDQLAARWGTERTSTGKKVWCEVDRSAAAEAAPEAISSRLRRAATGA